MHPAARAPGQGDGGRGLGGPRWPAGLVLLALAGHTAHKLEIDRVAEMLWGCHVASLAIALGLLLRRPLLAATGFLFQIALGVPAWLLDVVARGTSHASSILVHTLPPLVAALSFRGRPLPRATPWCAFLLYVAVLPPSYLATPAALNVNLAHGPWPPVASLLPGPWLHRVVHAVAAIAALHLVHATRDRLLRRGATRV